MSRKLKGLSITSYLEESYYNELRTLAFTTELKMAKLMSYALYYFLSQDANKVEEIITKGYEVEQMLMDRQKERNKK